MEKKTQAAIYGREAYESKVALEALERAGRSPNLKGNVHEILVRDKINCSPNAILDGKRAVLTQSKTAPVKDLMVMRGNKVAGHMQLKDTVSSAGARKTARQILSGKYDKTAMRGTDETVEAVAKGSRKAANRMQSSGISSSTTERIAQRALGTMPSVATLANAAKSGGTAGALIGSAIEAGSSTMACMRGEKSLGEAAGDVTVSAIKGGLTGAGSSMAASMGSALTGSLVSSFAGAGMAMTALPAIGGFAAACFVGHKISSWLDS